MQTETHDADRAEMIGGLRAMADWLEAHPGVAADRYCPVTMNLFAESEEEARAVRAAAPGGWEKNARGDYLSYTRTFSGNGNSCTVQYQVHVSKKNTCERVQVGTRRVEAVEAHEEPVWEWRCGPGAEADVPAPELPVVPAPLAGRVTAARCPFWSDPADDLYARCVRDAGHDDHHESDLGQRWTGTRWQPVLMCESVFPLPRGGVLKCIGDAGHDGVHSVNKGKRRWTGSGETAVDAPAVAVTVADGAGQ